MTIALDTAYPRRVLFVDLQEVAALDGAEQVVNTATKCPHNPSWHWDSSMSGTPCRRGRGPAG